MTDSFKSSNCPCKGCVPPKRSITCHSTCEAYIVWKHGLNEQNSIIKEKKAAEVVYCKKYTKRGQR